MFKRRQLIMDNKWIKGNKPTNEGIYWISYNHGGKTSVLLSKFDSIDNKWHLFDRQYAVIEDQYILAYTNIEIPLCYNPDKIGISGQYYVKVLDEYGNISYYSKQWAFIEWSKIGYSTAEKAYSAATRARKLDLQANPTEMKNYYVVDAYNNIIKVVAEDIK